MNRTFRCFTVTAPRGVAGGRCAERVGRRIVVGSIRCGEIGLFGGLAAERDFIVGGGRDREDEGNGVS